MIPVGLETRPASGSLSSVITAKSHDLVSCDDLSRLDSRFDVFEDAPPVPTTLVRLGCVPPLPVHRNDLVWGSSVLRAAREDGLDRLTAVRVEGTPAELIETAVTLEHRRDRFTLREKAALFDLCRHLDVDPNHPGIVSAVQTRGAFSGQAEQFLSLPNAARETVLAGRIDLRNAARLTRIPAAVWDAVRRCDRLSASSTRLFLTGLEEVARRDDLDGDATESLADDLLSHPEPAEAMRLIRYPTVAEFDSRLEAIQQTVLSGTGVSISPPTNYEGDRYTVTLGFADRHELDERLKAASGLLEHCDELFDLL